MTTPAEAVKPRLIDRIVGPSPREQALTAQIEQIESAFAAFANKHENWMISMGEGGVSMHEALQNIDLMLDAQGWTQVFEYEDDAGLTLRQVKAASKQLRELIVGNPFIFNGYRIRNAQTHGGGCDFAAMTIGSAKIPPKVAPLTTEARKLADSTWAQRYIFGNKARSELEKAVFTDGIVFLLGRESDKRMQRIQIQEITGALRNPNNSEEVWAYRREWVVNAQDPNKSQTKRTRWYYTDVVPLEERSPTIQIRGDKIEKAEVGYTILDLAFNRQIGWAFGVPDALCVVAWARLYKEFLVNGYVMSRSLARLAYKITSQTTAGANNSAVTVATPGQAGSTFVEGSGNQLTPLATAGKGYDFASGNGLAAAIAAGLGVSVLALTANPAAASGSNAAATTLDPVAKATAAVRRQEWNDEYARIFRFFGMTRKLKVTWHDLPEDTVARIMQAWTLVDQMEIFDGEVLFQEVARAMNIGEPGELLKGWKPKSERGAQNTSTFGQTGTSPADGRGADDGSGGSQDDHDDDTT